MNTCFLGVVYIPTELFESLNEKIHSDMYTGYSKRPEGLLLHVLPGAARPSGCNGREKYRFGALLYVSAGRGRWVARVEAKAGEPEPASPASVPQRGLLPGGQELWTAPPFTDGSIIGIETTVGLVYLVTVLTVPQPRRQEGGRC